MVIDLVNKINYNIESTKRHEEFLHAFLKLNNLEAEKQPEIDGSFLNHSNSKFSGFFN